MPDFVFTDRAKPPSAAQALQTVGRAGRAWLELTRFAAETYGAASEFKFYGTRLGWALRLRKTGKALFSLYAQEGSFTAQVVLPQGAVRQVARAGLSSRTRNLVRAAHPYPEGRWVFLPISSRKDAEEVERLVSLKAPAPRKVLQAGHLLQ